MREGEIIRIALENLQKTAGITGKWKGIGPKETEGKIKIRIENQEFVLHVEGKREVREQHLQAILELAGKYDPLVVVATRIYPNVKEALRKNGVAYLEENGNFYLKLKGKWIWIETQKPVQTARENGNRAFTKTGARVLFHFLLDEDLINKPYREIAKRTGAGLGNIKNIIHGLMETGFLIRLKKDELTLTNKKELLERWVRAYQERLKPFLRTGTFRFLNEQEFFQWNQLNLKPGKTCWGGEAAGDILTNYLKPDALTLYTTESRADLVKNYRLLPDEKGNIKVYEKFWTDEEQNLLLNEKPIVPPLLAYADLIHEHDTRCVETAQKIYHDFLEAKF